MTKLKLLNILFCNLIFSSNIVLSQLSLEVVYPREDLTITATDSTFIFGSVSNPRAQLIVNKFPMRIYPNGAFLGIVPVTPGDFTFRCLAVMDSNSVEVLRKVYIPPYLTTTPQDTLAVDTSYIFPREDIELQPGDFLHVTFKGTPGLMGTFTVAGLVENASMFESSPWKEFYWGEAVFGEDKPPTTPEIAGVYHGVYKIEPGIDIQNAEIVFKLSRMNGSSVITTAPGKLTVRNDLIPQIAQLTEELTVARTGPGLGYQLFLPKGVKLWITGKHGRYYRARLSSSQDVWLPEDNLTFLPQGASIPTSTVSVVRTENLPNKSQVKIFLQERLPFSIEQVSNPAYLILSIFGAISDTDWIRYDFSDPTIREIKWSQPANLVYKLNIRLNQKQQWGYNPYYEDNNLILEIKKPPKRFSLKNLLIGIDPGHEPDFGAVGPTGLKEKDANLNLSLVLKEMLEKKGAKVFLTRQGQHGANLSVRPKLAALMGADILLSIHHNAIPDGVNPFTSRGSSTYYYHPQSRPLAAAILKRLQEKLKLPNFGLYYDNLALCRPPQMPAVLIEPAFIMHPEEEMMINSHKYQKKTAKAIIKGIEDFLKQAKN
ncbi:MAG: N-acetylmuramoyl-L-alanine amidase [bacterium]